MRMDILPPLLASILHASVAHAERPSQPSSVMCIVVLDDQGIAVAGATVEIDCYDRPPSVKGTTDTNGCFRYQDHVRGGLACEATKSGYYKTAGELWSGPSSAGRVPPVNVYTVVLKRIVNPVAMDVRLFKGRIPRFDERIGFDLEIADWVAPFGKGTIKDLLVHAHIRDDGARDYEKTLELTFSNKRDGLLPYDGPNRLSLKLTSVFPVPQFAPEVGYLPKWVVTRSRKPNEPPVFSQKEEGRQYIFRVRSRENERGELIAANYGWILGDFDLSGPRIDMRLEYFYNRDSTSRSLEPEEIAKRQAGP